MRRPHLVALALLLPGLVGLVIGSVLSPRATLAAYLSGFAFALSISLGCLFLVIIAHATRARWLLAYRRFAEIGGGTLFLLCPAFLPILLGAPLIYRWVDDTHAHPWLDFSFFVLRALGYFSVWIVVAEVLFHFSLHQDVKLPSTTARLRWFAAASIWPVVLTFTFAVIDWFMSLDPKWVSSMYPVHFFAGSFLATLALIGLIPRLLPRQMDEIGPSHRHNVGRLELTFVIFWAYIAFCQFMIIWLADLPHEVGWYLARMDGVWGALAIGLIVGHFALPFFVLLRRQPKRRQAFLTAIGAWLLLAHWFEMIWVIVPSADPHSEGRGFWLDLSALLFFTGLLLAAALWRGAGRPLLARNDPLFPEALRYRTR